MYPSSGSKLMAIFASLVLMVSCSSQKEADDRPEKEGAEQEKKLAKNLKPIPIDPLPAGAIARMGTYRWRTGEGEGLTFSPDGKLLTCSKRNELLLLDVESGKFIRNYDIDPEHFTFSRGGKALLSAQRGAFKWPSLVREVDFDSGKELRRFLVKDGIIYHWSSDAKILLCARTFSRPDVSDVILYDTDSGKAIHQWDFQDPKNGIYDGALSPDGKTVALRYYTHYTLCESATGKELHRLPNPVWSALLPVPGKNLLAFSSDGKELVTIEKESICRWSTATGKISHRFQLPGNQPLASALSPDYRFLAAATKDSHVFIWELAGNKLLYKIPTRTSFLAFSPNSKTLAGREAEAIRLWDVSSGEEITPAAAPTSIVNAVVFLPDGKTLASVGWLGPACLWETTTGKLLRQFPVPPPKVGRWNGNLRVSPDGNVLLYFTVDQLILWKLKTGQKLYEKEFGKDPPSQYEFLPDGKTVLMVYGALVSSKGTRIVRPARIVLWDVKQMEGTRSFDIPGEKAPRVLLAPDGKNLAAIGQSLFLFDVETGKKLCEEKAPHAYDFSFSADGKTLMWAQAQHGNDKFLIIHFWDVATKKLRGHVQFPVEKTSIPMVAVSNNDLAAVVWGKLIHILDLKTGKELGHFSGHEQGVSTLGFSRDGRYLASGGWDTTVLVWDLTKLEEP